MHTKQLIIHCLALVLLVLGAPYWVGAGGDVAAESRPE